MTCDPGHAHRQTGRVDAPRTIVFDFDHTLTTCDSAARFFRWLLWRRAWRMLLVAISIPLLAPLLVSRVTRKLPVRYAVWVATLGRSDAAIAELIKAHVDELVNRGQLLLMADAKHHVQVHLAAGDRVVVATGSLELLAREILDRAGLNEVPVVGSTLKRWLQGWVADAHCFGARKVPMLSARGFPPPWAISYTDHHCDLPLIRHSADYFLVNARAQSIRKVSADQTGDPKVLRWGLVPQRCVETESD